MAWTTRRPTIYHLYHSYSKVPEFQPRTRSLATCPRHPKLLLPLLGNTQCQRRMRHIYIAPLVMGNLLTLVLRNLTLDPGTGSASGSEVRRMFSLIGATHGQEDWISKIWRSAILELTASSAPLVSSVTSIHWPVFASTLDNQVKCLSSLITFQGWKN